MEPCKSIGSGKRNTQLIVDNCSDTSAAWIIDNFNGFGYNDWFLFKRGIRTIYQNIYHSGVMSQVNEVWSSSEDNRTGQWHNGPQNDAWRMTWVITMPIKSNQGIVL